MTFGGRQAWWKTTLAGRWAFHGRFSILKLVTIPRMDTIFWIVSLPRMVIIHRTVIIQGTGTIPWSNVNPRLWSKGSGSGAAWRQLMHCWKVIIFSTPYEIYETYYWSESECFEKKDRLSSFWGCLHILNSSLFFSIYNPVSLEYLGLQTFNQYSNSLERVRNL